MKCPIQYNSHENMYAKRRGRQFVFPFISNLYSPSSQSSGGFRCWGKWVCAAGGHPDLMLSFPTGDCGHTHADKVFSLMSMSVSMGNRRFQGGETTLVWKYYASSSSFSEMFFFKSHLIQKRNSQHVEIYFLPLYQSWLLLSLLELCFQASQPSWPSVFCLCLLFSATLYLSFPFFLSLSRNRCLLVAQVQMFYRKPANPWGQWVTGWWPNCLCCLGRCHRQSASMRNVTAYGVCVNSRQSQRATC